MKETNMNNPCCDKCNIFYMNKYQCGVTDCLCHREKEKCKITCSSFLASGIKDNIVQFNPCDCKSGQEKCKEHDEENCTNWHESEQAPEWEEEFYNDFVLKQNGDLQEVGFWSTYPTKGLHTADRIKSFIRSVLEKSRQEQRNKYDSIFKWLLGENGDFPDLSQKPHYKFRTELREKLASLTPNSETKK